MKKWVELYRAQRRVRTRERDTIGPELRRRLIKLAAAGHCARSVQGRFTYKVRQGTDLREWSIAEGPESLSNVAHLSSATLSLSALTGKNGHLHMLTIVVEGTREDTSRWTIAVHLPDDRETTANPDGDRQGRGAGGHAALHCHVGPGLETAPKVRVPMPDIEAADALDWVLSQVIDTDEFEPAPWRDVEKELAAGEKMK